MVAMHRLVRMSKVLPILILFTGLAGCVSDQQVIAQANDVHNDLEPAVLTDPTLDAYVQEVGDKIVEAAQDMYEAGELGDYDVEPWMFEDIEFHFVASPVTNAFTTGGKHVYMYTGLFENAETEDAFAAVVAHEFGHIIGRHVHESMGNQYKLLGAAALAGGAAALLSEDGNRTQNATTFGTLALTGGQLANLQFGRENEREADELGFDFYVRAGYDPQKFKDFFEAMIAEQAKAGGGGGGGIQGYFSSHPQLQERVNTAEQMAEQVDPTLVEANDDEPPVADSRRYAELQERSRPITREAAEAATSGRSAAMEKAMSILAAFPACVGGPSDNIPPGSQKSSVRRRN
jgi:predicted Zn-dependent protease